jgi:hypothetical protein
MDSKGIEEGEYDPERRSGQREHLHHGMSERPKRLAIASLQERITKVERQRI